MNENWTELKIKVPAPQADIAGAIANMVVPYGIYMEDYSHLEEGAMEIAHIGLIDEELQSGVLDDYNTSRHGETMDVLCEGFDDEQQLWFGRTYADSVEVDGHVYFESDDTPQAGEFVPVLITESLGPDLLGVQQKGE